MKRREGSGDDEAVRGGLQRSKEGQGKKMRRELGTLLYKLAPPLALFCH